MSNTKHTEEVLVRFLVSLSEEHILFLRMHATMINDNGERWYHLPNYYRQVKENIFEVMPPDQVPKEVKYSQHSENQSLLEALKECEEYFENKADADFRDEHFIPNPEMKLLVMIREKIKQAENNE